MNYFFVSDVHLGLNTHRDSQLTQKMFERWLRMVRGELNSYKGSDKGLVLAGDIFDFWFEYNHVVPKGFVGILSLLQQICDDGIDVIMLKGNHDCWSRGYLASLGIKFIDKPFFELNTSDTNIYITHGDEIFSHYNLGSKILYTIFNNRVIFNLFSWLVHPDLAFRLAKGWSKKSRKSKYVAHTFSFEDEPFVKHIRKQPHPKDKQHYYIMGHLHSPIIYQIEENVKLMVLGHWIEGEIVYGKFDDKGLYLANFV